MVQKRNMDKLARSKSKNIKKADELLYLSLDTLLSNTDHSIQTFKISRSMMQQAKMVDDIVSASQAGW